MSTPYGGNDPQQWGQQPGGPGGTPSGGFPAQQPPAGYPQGGQPWGQQPGQQQWGQQPGQQQWGQQPGQQQWGQQPGQQPQQQWGQPPQQQWAQQPGYGQYPSGPEPKKSKTGLLIGLVLLVVAVLVAVVLLFIWPGFAAGKVFDHEAVQNGVSQVLDAKGIQVENVTCPEGEPVEQDHTFQCDATVDGQQKKVTIKVIDEDAARYEVSDPR